MKLQLPGWGGPKDSEEQIKFKQFLNGKTTHEELIHWLRAHRNVVRRLTLENAFNKLKKKHAKTLKKCAKLKNKVAKLTKELKELKGEEDLKELKGEEELKDRKELKGGPDEPDD